MLKPRPQPKIQVTLPIVIITKKIISISITDTKKRFGLFVKLKNAAKIIA